MKLMLMPGDFSVCKLATNAVLAPAEYARAREDSNQATSSP